MSKYQTLQEYYIQEMGYTKNIEKIFIDLSYLIYNSFIYTLRDKYDGPLDYDIHKNGKFLTLFKKHVNGNLHRISKSKGIDFRSIIFVRDCLRHNIWRHNIDNNYKRSRPTDCIVKDSNNSNKSNKYNIGEIFKYVYHHLIEEIVKPKGIYILHNEVMEADDGIACCVRYLDSMNVHSIVISADQDFLQLKSKNVEICNLRLNQIESKNPHFSIVKKYIYGDVNDNISPLEVDKNQHSVLNFEDNIIDILSKASQEDLIKNVKLINFNYIPSNLTNVTLNKFEEYLDTLIHI